MSIMKRVRDMTIATLNERLEQSEDPVRWIDRTLQELYQQIRESEQLSQQLAAHAVMLRNQTAQAQQMCAKREQQAELAVKAGEEAAAKLALQDKLMYQEQYFQYHRLYEENQQTLLQLQEQLNACRSEYQEIYSKRQYYAARMETIRLQQRMARHTSGAHLMQGQSAFQRLEEHVSELEHETRAYRELRGMHYDEQGYGKFASQASVEAELARMKHKLTGEGGRQE